MMRIARNVWQCTVGEPVEIQESNPFEEKLQRLKVGQAIPCQFTSKVSAKIFAASTYHYVKTRRAWKGIRQRTRGKVVFLIRESA